MKLFTNVSFASEGTDVESVEMEIPGTILNDIQNAKHILKQNDFLRSVAVNRGATKTKCFQYDTEEEENKASDFRAGSDWFDVYLCVHGFSIHYTSQSAMDCSQCFEVTLDL